MNIAEGSRRHKPQLGDFGVGVVAWLERGIVCQFIHIAHILNGRHILCSYGYNGIEP